MFLIICLWQQPLARQLPYSTGILGCGTESADGGDDALIVFYTNVLAMTNRREIAAADACYLTDLIARDVQAATFSTQNSTKCLVT